MSVIEQIREWGHVAWFILLGLVVGGCFYGSYTCLKFKSWPLGGLALTAAMVIYTFFKVGFAKEKVKGKDKFIYEIIFEPKDGKSGFFWMSAVIVLLLISFAAIGGAVVFTLMDYVRLSSTALLVIALFFVAIDAIILNRSDKELHSETCETTKRMLLYSDVPATFFFAVLLVLSLCFPNDCGEFCYGGSAGIMIYGNVVIAVFFYGTKKRVHDNADLCSGL